MQGRKETIIGFTYNLWRYLNTLCFQVSSRVDRMHEEQDIGQVLQRTARSTAAFFASGLLSLETCPANPQVPPTFARKHPLKYISQLGQLRFDVPASDTRPDG